MMFIIMNAKGASFQWGPGVCSPGKFFGFELPIKSPHSWVFQPLEGVFLRKGGGGGGWDKKKKIGEKKKKKIKKKKI